MTPQQIKAGMTPGTWYLESSTFICSGNENIVDCFTDNIDPALATCESNALAITTAVNATYGAGIDPEKVGEMVNILQGFKSLSDLWVCHGEIDDEHAGECQALSSLYLALGELLNSIKL